MRGHLVSALCIALAASARADFIRLYNGREAQTTVVDTAGCMVTIERNGGHVPIEKKLIEFVVIGADTLRYQDSECPKPEPGKYAQKFRDTPRQKLWQKLHPCRPVRQALADSAPVAFLAVPLFGATDEEYVVRLRSRMADALGRNGHSVVDVELSWVSEHLGDRKCSPRYVAVTRELTDASWRYENRGWLGLSAGWATPVDYESGVTTVYTDFVLLDLHQCTFAYDTVFTTRRRAARKPAPPPVPWASPEARTVDVRGAKNMGLRGAAREVTRGVNSYLRWARWERRFSRR